MISAIILAVFASALIYFSVDISTINFGMIAYFLIILLLSTIPLWTIVYTKYADSKRTR